MECTEDDLESALLVLWVNVDGDPATVVGNRRRRAVFVQGHRDGGRVPVHGLVYRVVQNLPDEVMEARGTDPTNVHTGALADGIESLENRNVLSCVVRRHGKGAGLVTGEGGGLDRGKNHLDELTAFDGVATLAPRGPRLLAY